MRPDIPAHGPRGINSHKLTNQVRLQAHLLIVGPGARRFRCSGHFEGNVCYNSHHSYFTGTQYGSEWFLFAGTIPSSGMDVTKSRLRICSEDVYVHAFQSIQRIAYLYMTNVLSIILDSIFIWSACWEVYALHPDCKVVSL